MCLFWALEEVITEVGAAMSEFLSPAEATIWFLLFDATGWLALFVYDHNHCRRILPYVNSMRLLKSGFITVGLSYLFYNYVPDSTSAWFLAAHGAVFLLYPTYLFYPVKARALGWVMSIAGLSFVVFGLWVNHQQDRSWWPVYFYALIVPSIYIYFHSGGRYVVLRYYYKRPFWY